MSQPVIRESSSATASGGTLSIPVHNSLQIGDIILVFVASYNSSSWVAPTMSSAWNALTGTNINAGSARAVAFWHRWGAGGETANFWNVTCQGTDRTVAVAVSYRGCDSGCPLNVNAPYNNTNTTTAVGQMNTNAVLNLLNQVNAGTVVLFGLANTQANVTSCQPPSTSQTGVYTQRVFAKHTVGAGNTSVSIYAGDSVTAPAGPAAVSMPTGSGGWTVTSGCTTATLAVFLIPPTVSGVTRAPSGQAQIASGLPNPMNWSGPVDAIFADDNSRVVIGTAYSQDSNFIRASGFNFNVPSSAAIMGVQVDPRFRCFTQDPNNNYPGPGSWDLTYALTDLSNGSFDNSTVGAHVQTWITNVYHTWSASSPVDGGGTYGGLLNFWGRAAIPTSADVNSPIWGYCFLGTGGTSDPQGVVTTVCEVDYMPMTVWYWIPLDFVVPLTGLEATVQQGGTSISISGSRVLIGQQVAAVRGPLAFFVDGARQLPAQTLIMLEGAAVPGLAIPLRSFIAGAFAAEQFALEQFQVETVDVSLAMQRGTLSGFAEEVSDIYADLVGRSLTVGQGLLGSQQMNVAAPAGLQLMGQQGAFTLVSNIYVTPVSALAAVQRGVFTPAVACTLFSLPLSLQQGTLSPVSAVSVALAGLQANTQSGALGMEIAVTAGLQAAVQRGAFVPVITSVVALAGQQLMGQQGGMGTPDRWRALTGLQAVVQQGLAQPSGVTAAALAGQQLTAQEGTLAPSSVVSVALTGLQADVQRGTPVAAAGNAVVLVGQQLLAQPGAFASAAAVALTGVQAATTGGALGTAIAVVSAGLQLVSQQGVFTPASANSSALTGQQASTMQGVLTPVVSVFTALTGQQAMVQRGAVSSIISAFAVLTGQQLVTQLSTMGTPDRSLMLTGLQATVQQGLTQPSGITAVALVGQQLNVPVGVFVPASTFSLFGAQLLAQSGTLTSALANMVTLAGQQVVTQSGALIPSPVVTLAGSVVTLFSSALFAVIENAGVLVGRQLSVQQGSLAPVGVAGATLTGLQLNTQQAALAPSSVVALTGLQMTIQPEGLVPINFVSLAGSQLVMQHGALATSIEVVVPLNGLQATVLQGLTQPSGITGAILTGQLLTVQAGVVVTPDRSVTLTGAQVVVLQGGLVSEQSVVLAGQGATISRGALGKALAVPLLGQAGSTQQGLFAGAADQATALIGLGLTVSAGRMTAYAETAQLLIGQSSAVLGGRFQITLAVELLGSELQVFEGNAFSGKPGKRRGLIQATERSTDMSATKETTDLFTSEPVKEPSPRAKPQPTAHGEKRIIDMFKEERDISVVAAEENTSASIKEESIDEFVNTTEEDWYA